ncbi:hypothetical protein Tco_0250754 [Tanacetum coccineum]
MDKLGPWELFHDKLPFHRLISNKFKAIELLHASLYLSHQNQSNHWGDVVIRWIKCGHSRIAMLSFFDVTLCVSLLSESNAKSPFLCAFSTSTCDPCLLHALVDDKKVIITEVTVRRDLQLEDEEGVDCLPNSTIFEQLTLMGSKTTAWNEFSSTMTSAIICLATNKNFSFLKYIFESMVRNLDNLSGKFLMYPRKPKRKDTQVPQPSDPTDIVADKAVHKELGDRLVRAATTASSLEAEQDSCNITKTRSNETPNVSSSLGTTSGGGPWCQETTGDTIAQTRFENVSKLSNDSPIEVMRIDLNLIN